MHGFLPISLEPNLKLTPDMTDGLPVDVCMHWRGLLPYASIQNDVSVSPLRCIEAYILISEA
jgi:hypothetical protein